MAGAGRARLAAAGAGRAAGRARLRVRLPVGVVRLAQHAAQGHRHWRFSSRRPRDRRSLSSAMWLLAAAVLALVAGRPAAGCRRVGARRRLREPVFGFGVLLYLLSLAVSYLLVAFEETRAAERRALELQVLAREAELRALRAQIDPHFLFNSLNSISALTTADPPGGAADVPAARPTSCARRLALGARDPDPLARELALVDRFLAIEQVRFGDRLRRRDRRRRRTRTAASVPPLLLQPLVENAVTHGDRAPARRRHGPHRRVAHGRPRCRSSSRTRATPTARAARAPASAWRTCARGCARCYGDERGRSAAASGTASGAWSCRCRLSTEVERMGGESSRCRPLRVVIVDDEPLARAVVREYLGGASRRRDRGRVRERVRGGEGGDRAGAGPAVPRRPDAEARRLRGARARRPRRAGRSSSPPTTSTRCAPSRCTRWTTCSSRSARSGSRRRWRARASGWRAGAGGDRRSTSTRWCAAARPRRAARARADPRRRPGARAAGRPDRLRRGAGRLRRRSRPTGKSFLKEQTLAEVEASLDPARFVRIHRSYLLNIERIARVELYAKDSRVAILRDGTQLPVSRAGYQRL